MVEWNVFNRNLNKHNAVWATPEEMFNDINEYLLSCQYCAYEKMNSPEGGNEMEPLTNVLNGPLIKWYKLPTITGFCGMKGILRETYYNQAKRKNPKYKVVMDYFSNIIREAAENCLLDSKTYRGAVYMLEAPDRAAKIKQAQIENKNKNENDEIRNELARVQIKLLQEKVNQLKQGNDKPYIDTFSADLNSAMNSFEELD